MCLIGKTGSNVDEQRLLQVVICTKKPPLKTGTAGIYTCI